MLAPDLDAVETAMVDAWGDLAGDRLTQFGPIPYSAVDRWCARNGVDDPDDFAFVVRAVRAADQAYLAWAADELKSPPPPSPQDRRA